VEPERRRGGSAGPALVEQLLKKQSLASHCGLILFAFDEPQKITKKRLFRLQVACYALSTRKQITATGDCFSGFPRILGAVICGPISDAGISFSARTLRIAGKKNNSFALINMYRSIGFDQALKRARKKCTLEVLVQSARQKRSHFLDYRSNCG
jgi:hypothetical protein